MNSKVPVDIEPGEAFFRISVDDDGTSRFVCGLYPCNNSIEKDFDADSDVNLDDLLAVFMAGIAHMVKDDMDTILHNGMQYIMDGNHPFDFIVGADDTEFYGNLTEEQYELLRMDTQGEA